MVKEKLNKFWVKLLHAVLDTLLFVVPILEINEVIGVIPPEYLPWYMLATLFLRRLVRILEGYLDVKLD